MERTFIFDSKNYPEGGSVLFRTAVRGIIVNNRKLLLVTNKFGDYKFPGGGVEENESLEDALSREILEETGYRMKAGSQKLWCTAKERRRGTTADILEMTSHYFFCEVEGAPSALSLEDYELEEEFRPVWFALPPALEKNRALLKKERNPWVLRETSIMEELLKTEPFSLPDKEAAPC